MHESTTFYIVTKVTPQRVTVQEIGHHFDEGIRGGGYYSPNPSVLVEQKDKPRYIDKLNKAIYVKKPYPDGRICLARGVFIRPWNGKKIFDDLQGF
jgi:hypothetical protein